MLGGLRAGSARSRIGGATFARECNAASPCARRHRRGLACWFLVAEDIGVLIVESTSRGSDSFPSGAHRHRRSHGRNSQRRR